MDGLRPPDRLRTRFGQAEMTHFPRTHEVGHRAHRVLNRRFRIDPVLIVEIDYLDPEPLEARIAGLAHVVRPAVGCAGRSGIRTR